MNKPSARWCVRVRRFGAAAALVGTVLLGGGCARLIGGPISVAEHAPMAPGAVLRMETEQRGTRVILTNSGPAPLEVRWPADGERVMTLAPGETWKKRLRWEHELEVANTGAEATRLLIDAKTWNFRMGYDMQHSDPAAYKSTTEEHLRMPAVGSGARD